MPKYGLTIEEVIRLDKDFIYHIPKYDQTVRYEAIRSRARWVARFMMESCPRCRELSLAITKLEEAVFWANAAIARNELEEPCQKSIL